MLLATLLLGATLGLASDAPDARLAKHTLVCGDPKSCSPALAKLIVFDDKDEESQCTGFLVGEKLVATNRHCLPDSGKIFAQFAAVDGHEARLIASRGVLGTSPAVGAAQIELQDYAFVELAESPGRKPLVVSRDGVAAGQKLTMLKVERLVDSVIRSEPCETLSGSLLFPFSRTSHSPTITLKGCHSTHGNSGSPLVNAKGEVVAVLEGLSGAQSYDYFREKFKLGEFQKVQKATNFACVCLPGQNDCTVADECKTAHAEADFLVEGNKLFQESLARSDVALEHAARPHGLSELALSGLRWKPRPFFDSQYQDARLRPDSYHYALFPSCIESLESLKSGSKKRASSDGSRFTHYKLIRSRPACTLSFDLSDFLVVGQPRLGACASYDYLVSFNEEGWVRVGVLNPGPELRAWREEQVPRCDAK